MISPIMILIFTGVFAIIQITIFKAFPPGLRRVLAYQPMLALMLNFAGSFTIMFFTGTAYFVGPLNLFASVFFAAYVFAYKKHRGIHMVRRGKLRFPGLAEHRPEPHWLF